MPDNGGLVCMNCAGGFHANCLKVVRRWRVENHRPVLIHEGPCQCQQCESEPGLW